MRILERVDKMEFQAQVSGHEALKRSTESKQQQHHLADWQLADELERERPILLLPGIWSLPV